MSKKTKKSRVTTAALGSLAGIATVVSVASVIACGHGGGGTKESASSTQQIDTSHINLRDVKISINGEVQGLPQLPKGVHFDYFLDGQTKVVHDVHDLGKLMDGEAIWLQLGADDGYVISMLWPTLITVPLDDELQKIKDQIRGAHIYSDGTTIGLGVSPDSVYVLRVTGIDHAEYLKPDGQISNINALLSRMPLGNPRFGIEIYKKTSNEPLFVSNVAHLVVESR